MSTPLLPEEDEQFVTARDAVFQHAQTCDFCRKPGYHNRGICKENLRLNEAAADAYNAAKHPNSNS